MSKQLTGEAQEAIRKIADVLTVGPPEVLMADTPQQLDRVLASAVEAELHLAAEAAYWLMKSAFDPPSDVPKSADTIIPRLRKALDAAVRASR